MKPMLTAVAAFFAIVSFIATTAEATSATMHVSETSSHRGVTDASSGKWSNPIGIQKHFTDDPSRRGVGPTAKAKTKRLMLSKKTRSDSRCGLRAWNRYHDRYSYRSDIFNCIGAWSRGRALVVLWRSGAARAS
jgi:hypothetical protein